MRPSLEPDGLRRLARDLRNTHSLKLHKKEETLEIETAEGKAEIYQDKIFKITIYTSKYGVFYMAYKRSVYPTEGRKQINTE